MKNISSFNGIGQISPSQISPSQISYSVNNTWSTLLPQINIDIIYQITDRTTEQLAEATNP